MRTNKQIAMATDAGVLCVGFGDETELLAITKWVHAVRMTKDEDMGKTFSEIATYFNESWEVTVYEGNQYAADIISRTL